MLTIVLCGLETCSISPSGCPWPRRAQAPVCGLAALSGRHVDLQSSGVSANRSGEGSNLASYRAHPQHLIGVQVRTADRPRDADWRAYQKMRGTADPRAFTADRARCRYRWAAGCCGPTWPVVHVEAFYLRLEVAEPPVVVRQADRVEVTLLRRRRRRHREPFAGRDLGRRSRRARQPSIVYCLNDSTMMVAERAVPGRRSCDGSPERAGRAVTRYRAA